MTRDFRKVEVVKMPVVEDASNPKDVKVLLRETREATLDLLSGQLGHDHTLFIEEIPKWAGASRFAKQTVQASSLAVLYGNMSLCIGIALGLGWRVEALRPQQWQKAVECTNDERLEKGPWKNKLKAHAQRLFPTTKVVAWNSDALLIARAGMLLGLA